MRMKLHLQGLQLSLNKLRFELGRLQLGLARLPIKCQGLTSCQDEAGDHDSNEKVRHENVTGQIADFFAPQGFLRESFENIQTFDFESLMGRVLSASYTPDPVHPSYEPMIASLREVFEEHQEYGTIAFEYDTRIYYGQLSTH